jgi:hypothetical protein
MLNRPPTHEITDSPLPLDDCLYALRATILHLTRSSLHREAGKVIAAQLLGNLVVAVSYVIHTVLTGNGIQFTNMAHHKYAFHHILDQVSDGHEIEHRLTKIKHPGPTASRADEPNDQGGYGQALTL